MRHRNIGISNAMGGQYRLILTMVISYFGEKHIHTIKIYEALILCFIF